jgi:putative peptidoglycan lipid II flippase
MGVPVAADAITASATDDIEAENAGAAGRTAGAGRAGFAGAALLIAGLTVLSRVVGFGRTLILGSVAASGVSQAYVTANTIPNIIFEVVAGGALASLVVPLVAGAIARADRADVGRTVSALLTWVLAILVPLAALVAILARPIIELAMPSTAPDQAATVDVATGMLRVFAPQIPLYGIGIVLGGLLQAHRRFAWPVLAPLLSSAVVIATYVTYGVTQPRNADIPHVSTTGQMILAVGTTLGVVVLSLSLIVPTTGLRLRYRPTFRFTGDARRTVAGLAGVAVVTVAAQQLALFVGVRLANDGSDTSVYMFTLAQTVYLVPWSVLALPVATSVYPALATSAATGDDDGYRRVLAGATRSVLLLSALGAAGLVAAATPLARLFATISDATRPDPAVLAEAFATFAVGLLGYGLFALHSRALYARGQNRFAAVATLAGWGTVVAASFALAQLVPVDRRVVALTTANSVGMTVLAVVLVVMVARRTGRGSLAGVPRALLAAVVAGAAAAAAGIAVRQPLPDGSGVAGDIGRGLLSGVVALVVFVLLAVLLDRDDARPMAARLSRLLRRGRTGGSGPGPVDDHGGGTGPDPGDGATATRAARDNDDAGGSATDRGM